MEEALRSLHHGKFTGREIGSMAESRCGSHRRSLEPPSKLISVLVSSRANVQETREAFALVSSLVNMKWQGIEQFILPHVAR